MSLLAKRVLSQTYDVAADDLVARHQRPGHLGVCWLGVTPQHAT
jgi:hypothetical protein